MRKEKLKMSANLAFHEEGEVEDKCKLHLQGSIPSDLVPNDLPFTSSIPEGGLGIGSRDVLYRHLLWL